MTNDEIRDLYYDLPQSEFCQAMKASGVSPDVVRHAIGEGGLDDFHVWQSYYK